MKTINELTAADRRSLTGPGLRIFWNLARVWSLTDNEQMILLGISSRSTLHRWRRGKSTALRRDTFKRVSLLLGIFIALNQLFGRGPTGDEWVRLPNSAPPFGGRSALELMLSGRVEDLYATRNYLEGLLTGWLA